MEISMSSTTSNAPSGIFSVFGNMKILTKMILGFALVLAILVTLSVLSYRALVRISDDVDLYSQRVSECEQARSRCRRREPRAPSRNGRPSRARP